MNTQNNLDDDTPFVNEECGDTMWDETLLNQLTESTTSQQSTPLEAINQPIETRSLDQSLNGTFGV